ncbi:GNAT family N-acetyltransferase [Microvirga arsenatis]|uniref:GNAT family N-acetyltransferase n=1 Tax=Microvirga arsenatis TaxID=2692265 RepID=A0ABW9YTI0_9HYPH|nr:GNAT family N-acetyltransferase [Microvirga arsenatis]NBJ09706.1 GNAT family N-acetyltransferase [Microvirga arsenatis]NBJ23435.1 GNAT family N-acetyltransferase [Microvirga arsenatis]
MTDHSLIIGLESRLLNAWPSFDYQTYDGWILRLANGYSKRANSATPFLPGAALDDELIDTMVARFVEANVRPTFRLNGLEAPDVDERLKQRGFKDIEPTHVLTAPITQGDCELDPEVALEPQVSKRWVREAAGSYGGDKADDEILMRIVSRIRQKAAFATLSLDERPVAWGLGVVERGYVGLYDIVVAPDLRGIGLGRRVVSSLMAWGCGQGAHTAYLQVREENEIARSLYGALGFQTAYRYTHRVMPGRSSSG